MIGLLARVLRDALLPLAIAYALVVFLTDPVRLDTSELLRNSLLMNELVNAQPTSTAGVVAVSFATLRLPVPGCWKLTISVGGAILEYTVYAYPWQCRPQLVQYPPIPGITPLPCTPP